MPKKKNPHLMNISERISTLRQSAQLRYIVAALIVSLVLSVIAFQFGNTQGYAAGYSNGQTDGYATGRSEGFSAGRAEGINVGYSQGESAGEKTGYSKGFIAGCETVFDYSDYSASYVTAYNPYSSWDRYPSGYYRTKWLTCTYP